MKRPAKRQPVSSRPPLSHLVLVHPLRDTDTAIVEVATHLLQQFAATQGKQPPDLSLDAAMFLVQQHWAADELARRVWRAVETNCGSLITAADLS
jgi:transcriptional regulator of aromatic amino acid metabolism